MPQQNAALQLSRTVWRLYRITIEYGQHLMDSEGLGDLQPTVAAVLVPLLTREGETLSDLADNLHMKAPTVTVIANRLEDRGWIRRKRGTEDRRQVHLYLTAEGREKAKILNRISRKATQHITAGLSKDELATASDILNRMFSNVESRLK